MSVSYLLEDNFGVPVNSEHSSDRRATVFAGPLRSTGADKTTPPVCALAVILARGRDAKVTFLWTTRDAAVVVDHQVEVDNLTIDVEVTDAPHERRRTKQKEAQIS